MIVSALLSLCNLIFAGLLPPLLVRCIVVSLQADREGLDEEEKAELM